MSKHLVARIVGTIATVSALVIMTTTRAIAANDPGLGEGSGTPPAPPVPQPFEVFGMAWQAALAIAIALIAVGGLVYSIQHRRHAAGQHA